MKVNFDVFLIISVIGLCACNDDSTIKDPDDNIEYLGVPVENLPPNTTYKPAFEGQTRIGSIKTVTELSIEEIANNLGQPWGITHMPNGNLLITEKSGFMNIVTADGKFVSKVEGLPAVDDAGQGGLLDVGLDPDFLTNRMIYWTFSEPYGGGNLTAVAKGRLSNDEKLIENTIVIFRAEPSYSGSLHFGGRIIFDHEGSIFVSTGERSDLVTRPQAQSLSSGLGKVMKINKNGQSISSNPFVGTQGSKPEIFSYGHRNVQGLAIHPETKLLWETEFGARGGDEINLIQASKNYGWPVISYGYEYNGSKIGEGITTKEGMEQPVYYWDPSISPSGIDFYTGTAIPEWRNNLFVGALSGKHIARIVIKNNKVAGEERLLVDRNERFRDVLASHPNQSVYAITDSGKLFKIVKK